MPTRVDRRRDVFGRRRGRDARPREIVRRARTARADTGRARTSSSRRARARVKRRTRSACARDAEDGEQRFLRHAACRNPARRACPGSRRAPISSRRAPADPRCPTRDSPGCSAAAPPWRPASAHAHRRAPVIVVRCSTTAEPYISRKKYSSGLLFEPAALGLALELRARADGDEHDALRIRLHERAPQTIAGERHAVDVNRPRADRRAAPTWRAYTHGRPCAAYHVARPLRQLQRAALEHVAARVTRAAACTPRLHVDVWTSVSPSRSPTRESRIHTGLNWQPSTKKSKKSGCVSSRQCSTRLTSRLELAALRAREQRDATRLRWPRCRPARCCRPAGSESARSAAPRRRSGGGRSRRRDRRRRCRRSRVP